MKTALTFFIIVLALTPTAWGLAQWEFKGNSYFLTKNTRDNFSASGAGSNTFPSKYLTEDGINFLVKAPGTWPDYGRLNLGNNHFFSVPIQMGMKVEDIHFLASGDYGNSYLHDNLLRQYGENYYYSVLTVTFVYTDGTYEILSAPIFWDWFHLPSIGWSKDGAHSKVVGLNPVRKNCTMYHLSFTNPKPLIPLKNILVSDSWVSDQPFSDVFALTIRSSDKLPAALAKGQSL